MFEGSTRGRKLIVSVSKADTNGIARIAHLQSFHRLFKINIHVSPGNPKFRSSPSQKRFSSSAWKNNTCRCRDAETVARHFYRVRHWATQTGSFSTVTSWLTTDSVVSLLHVFPSTMLPTSHRRDEMHGDKMHVVSLARRLFTRRVKTVF